MTSEQRLRRLIANLDQEARREITSAASEGRFDELSVLASLGKEIAALATRWSTASRGDQSDASEQVASTPAAGETTTTKSTKADSGVKKAEYPHFVREKQDLVKVGWSPREKGPYEHRTPKAGVDAVAAAIAARGQSGYRFTMAEIVKTLSAAKAPLSIPSYQTYAVVSWLKWAGLILQHGRQGYTVVRPQTFTTSIETSWQTLPQR